MMVKLAAFGLLMLLVLIIAWGPPKLTQDLLMPYYAAWALFIVLLVGGII